MQKYYYDVCSAIVAHMFVIESYIRSHGFESTEQYFQATRMNKPGVWATDIKIYSLVYRLDIPIRDAYNFSRGGKLGTHK